MSQLVQINSQREFQEIYHRHFNGLANYAYSVLKDKDAAKDVVQDVFLDLWNKRETLSIKTSLEAYLIRAVKFKSIDFIRKDKTKQQYVANMTPSGVPQTESDDGDERNEDRKKQLSYAIAQLPAKCRQVFLLSRVNGYTYKEIAEEMDISAKTVENQISRALKLLRQKLSDLMILIFFLNFL
ncbi:MULTISPECIES: RNA polymerase sigma-70 factor [unclassified Aureispira]|uniref:RNA polymerase sigma-70 factor n=1 Tax=unclassified Aureispira TaxID=2649989 RepID=UPI000698BCF4|nr:MULTISPECIES: RNA polymerase sigma-70 factor [unclassified Aureispira]WMX16173.1 RNA polymerase sigma-70 factor [Aureispira sp. CCB-E]